MFSLFGHFHRHKNLEDAILLISTEVSNIKLQNARMIAKMAVAERENKKIERETVRKTLPQDVRDILSQFPDAELESIHDENGHVVFDKREN